MSATDFETVRCALLDIPNATVDEGAIWNEKGLEALTRIQARLAEVEKERDEAFDEGIASVLDAIVCSVCGFNHDADESAPCVGCEPIAFGEWTRMARRRLALLENVAEAARECVTLEYDPARSQEINDELGRRAAALREALRALDGEGGTG